MRTIQDSEDEDDFELEEAADAPEPDGASADLSNRTPQPRESGTGSTGKPTALCRAVTLN